MADIQDTDLFLVNRNNSTGTKELLTVHGKILDDDDARQPSQALVRMKRSLGYTLKRAYRTPTSMTGATMAGAGLQAVQTYTTTLQNYNPGIPAATANNDQDSWRVVSGGRPMSITAGGATAGDVHYKIR